MRSRGRASLPASSRPRQTTRPVAWTYAQIDAWIRPMDRLKWESVLRARGWPRGNPETQPNALQLLAHDEHGILTRVHSSAYTRVHSRQDPVLVVCQQLQRIGLCFGISAGPAARPKHRLPLQSVHGPYPSINLGVCPRNGSGRLTRSRGGG